MNILISVNSIASRRINAPAVTVSVAFAQMVCGVHFSAVHCCTIISRYVALRLRGRRHELLVVRFLFCGSLVSLNLESYWYSFVLFPASRRLQLNESIYACSRCAGAPWFGAAHCRILFLSGWHNGQNRRTLFLRSIGESSAHRCLSPCGVAQGHALKDVFLLNRCIVTVASHRTGQFSGCASSRQERTRFYCRPKFGNDILAVKYVPYFLYVRHLSDILTLRSTSLTQRA